MTDTTQPPAETLAECPFCGAGAIWREDDPAKPDAVIGLVVDHSRECFLHWSSPLFRDLQSLRAAWNRRAIADAGAAEERDALLSALGWKTGPFRDALSRKVILDDSAALRPEMVKARQAAQDAQSRAQDYHYMLGEYVHGSRSGVLARLWEEVKRLRSTTPKPPAGGDAIPAGMSAVMGRILGHYSEDPGTLARIKGMVAQYREAPFRSADWLAGEIMRILDSEPANDTTSKPPAGGDAGAVRWRERWYGSDPQRGSAIVDEAGTLIAYFGGDEETHRATTAAVAAHNAGLAAPAPVVEGALPQDVVSLVVAAREAFDTGALPDDERDALDKALEPFASAVPYENEPDAVGVPAPAGETDPESAPGRVGWHTSEEGGGPDVGISLGLGFGSSLFIGDLLDRDGGPVGIVFHGPGGVRHAARLSELDEVRDLFEHHVAPAIGGLSERGGKVRTIDWWEVARLAGVHGVRYRTNRAMQAFLSDIAGRLPNDLEKIRAAREEGYRAAYKHVLGLARAGVPEKDFERDVGAYMADFTGRRA